MAKVLIVAAPYRKEIVDELAQGAVEIIEGEGHEYDIVNVHGALEVPLAIKFAAKSGKYDAYLALGCIVKGETIHDQVVAMEAFRGIARLSQDEELPIGNGILTVESTEQAIIRADRQQMNRGAEAAKACLGLLDIKKLFA